MKIRRRRGDTAVVESTTEEDQTPPIHQWTAGSALSTRAASLALTAALVCGPLALAVAGLTAAFSQPKPVAAAPAFDDKAGDRAAAGEIAQRAVVAWLTTARGREAQDAGLLPGYVAPETPFQVGQPVVADIQTEETGLWAVTVAITVTDQDHGAPTRYFVVPVQLTGSPGHRAGSVVALPAAVAGPAPVRGPTAHQGYRYRLATSSSAWQSAEAFLQALATGHGDITRYTTPGQEMVAIQPPPYTAIAITEVSSDRDDDDSPPDGHRHDVLVTARATAAGNRTVGLTYALTLQARGGRWEVYAIQPTPRIAPKAVTDPTTTPLPTPTRQ